MKGNKPRITLTVRNEKRREVETTKKTYPPQGIPRWDKTWYIAPEDVSFSPFLRRNSQFVLPALAPPRFSPFPLLFSFPLSSTSACPPPSTPFSASLSLSSPSLALLSASLSLSSPSLALLFASASANIPLSSLSRSLPSSISFSSRSMVCFFSFTILTSLFSRLLYFSISSSTSPQIARRYSLDASWRWLRRHWSSFCVSLSFRLSESILLWRSWRKAWRCAMSWDSVVLAGGIADAVLIGFLEVIEDVGGVGRDAGRLAFSVTLFESSSEIVLPPLLFIQQWSTRWLMQRILWI